MTTCATWVTLCPTEVQVGLRVAVVQWLFFTPSPGCGGTCLLGWGWCGLSTRHNCAAEIATWSLSWPCENTPAPHEPPFMCGYI